LLVWLRLRRKHRWLAADFLEQHVKYAPDPRQALPSRLAWILLFVGIGLAFAGAVAVIVVGSWPAVLPASLSELRLSARKTPPWSLISGLAAAPSLILTWWWRTKHKDEDIALAKRQEQSNRFIESIRLLSEKDKVELQLGALYSLESLVADSRDEYRRVIETICAFVRLHGIPSVKESQPEVVQAAFIIAGRLRPPGESPADHFEDIGRVTIDFSDCTLPRVRGLMCNFPEAHFIRTDLSGANFVSADLRGSHFGSAKLEKAYLWGADLRRANFDEADARECNFETANLEEGSLRKADLQGAIFTRADLRRAHLSRANLRGANLNQADLREADLSLADVQEADVTGADLRVASHTASRNRSALFDVNLTGAIFDSFTQFPDGFDPKTAGMKPMGGNEQIRMSKLPIEHDPPA
jgi:uncharacterized protein YjbI with pentapeptide repeats